MDVDAPMLREWCLMVVRNLCSWSEKIRDDLKSLQLIEVSPQGQQALQELGLEEMFRKELAKVTKKNNVSVNIDTVDF